MIVALVAPRLWRAVDLRQMEQSMFENRRDAGEKLAHALKHYKNAGALVLAIPKGGIEIGAQVARILGADFAPVICRKLPFPANPEAGFGAIAEDGSIYMQDLSGSFLAEPLVQRIIEKQKQEIDRRIALLRQGLPLPDLAGRTVILVDDGVAAGSTMHAAVHLCNNREAGRIVVASPVSSPQFAREISEDVDEVVVLEKPHFFRAVAQVYKNWYDVSDEEALELLQDYQSWRAQNA